MSICGLYRRPDPLDLMSQRISRCLLIPLCSQLSRLVMLPARNNKRDGQMPSSGSSSSSNNSYSYSHIYRSSGDLDKYPFPEWFKLPGPCSISRCKSTSISPPWVWHTRSLALLLHL